LDVPGPGAYDAHGIYTPGEPLKEVPGIVIKKHLSKARPRKNKEGLPIEEERVGPQTYFDPEKEYLRD